MNTLIRANFPVALYKMIFDLHERLGEDGRKFCIRDCFYKFVAKFLRFSFCVLQ